MAQDDTAALAARIDRLESRIAITDLIHGYARFIRYDQPEMAASLYLPDGTFEVRDGEPDRPEYTVRSFNKNRDEINAHLAPNKGKPHPIPLIKNIMIEVDGDTATGNCVMQAQVYGTSHTVMGEYRDTFRRVDGKWYFATRIYTIFRGGSTL